MAGGEQLIARESANDVLMIIRGFYLDLVQLILGHHDINTTMGYKAVYPQEAINGHRDFIARRRQLRPSCGRAYATSCIHEHSCLTEMILTLTVDSPLPVAYGG